MSTPIIKGLNGCYLDTETKELEGEIWVSVYGYEESYEVSSFGRVRSTDRVVPHPRLGSQTVKGRILKQKVSTNKNLKTGQPSCYVSVALSYEGKQKYHNVRRLVYSAFVHPIDFNQDMLVVLNIDGDGLNNQLHNLTVATYREKSKRAYIRDRVVESYLKTADRSTWSKPYGGKARMKPIRAIHFPTKKVFLFDSVTHASKITGIGEKEIIGVAKGRYKKWRSYIFQYV